MASQSLDALKDLTLKLTDLEKERDRLIKTLDDKIKDLARLAQTDFFWNNALGVFVVATPTHFVRVNPRWTELTGYTQEEMISRPFMEFIHPDDKIKTQDRVESNGQALSFVNRYKKKSGGYITLEWISRATIQGYFCGVARYLSDT